MKIDAGELKIAVVGLGYVGLPLAVEFGKHFPTVGMDIDSVKVEELKRGVDSSLEVEPEAIAASEQLVFSDNPQDLDGCTVFIVTVPTPIDEHNKPDLNPLIRASAMIGENLSQDGVVIYESTVYPGATEEVCVPVLEEASGLEFNQGFFVGYSPERINPGDKTNRLPTIIKVTSGSTEETAEFVDQLYRKIIIAGTYRASSIKVAEAAKVIENTQRDVNIALINELALLFNLMGIDTEEVLEAAGTKWNFLPFKPGLVGGHCIGVDPYYLTYKAQAMGYHPEMILAGRRLNDGMGIYIAGQVVKLMVQKGISIAGSRLMVLGLSFKENCPDLRNTRVVDIVTELRSYGALVDVHDPWVSPANARSEYGLELTPEPRTGIYDAVVIAVAHRQFKELGETGIRDLCRPGGVIYDVKHVLPAGSVEGRL